VSAALDDARDNHLSVLPFCPYVRAYIADHLEYLDLVPIKRRSSFRLPADQTERGG
jgi:hypothetical protein